MAIVHDNALDDEAVLESVTWLLKENGYDVVPANGGEQCLDALPEGPMILGADLNNWFGPDEQALRVQRARAHDAATMTPHAVDAQPAQGIALNEAETLRPKPKTTRRSGT